MIGLLITLGLILLNGFFVAAEFSLVKIRSSQIDLLTQQGNKKAKLIQHIHDHLDRYLSACQLGITIASLALGWVGEPFVAEQLIHRAERLQIDISPETAHKIAVPLAFALITAGHIVVGELAPKSWAIRDSLRVSFLAAYPLRLFTKIFSPIIRFLTWLSNILLYLCGIAPASEDETHSEAELRMIVTESEEDGQINAGERDLIHNVFEFDNRQVSEIMAPIDKVFSIDIDAWDEKLIHGLIIEGYSRIPVYKGDINNIIGWVLLKDMLRHYFNSKKQIPIDSLIRPMQFVPENMKIADCLKFLQQLHYHLAIVTSEYGTTLGLVTMEDILEELVGDIHDEGDEEHAIVEQKNDQSYVVDASASISDVNDHLPIALPEGEEYDTVAGYINHLFGRIPSLHEKITTDAYTIIVTKRKKQRVEQIRLELVL